MSRTEAEEKATLSERAEALRPCTDPPLALGISALAITPVFTAPSIVLHRSILELELGESKTLIEMAFFDKVSAHPFIVSSVGLLSEAEHAEGGTYKVPLGSYAESNRRQDALPRPDARQVHHGLPDAVGELELQRSKRQRLGQERAMLREERHNFSVPVLEHRKDLAAQCDKLFCHQKEMAVSHASQLQCALSAAHGRRRAHGASRAEALGEIRARARRGACGAGQVRAHAAAELISERSRLQDVSASCAACSRAISLLHKEMAHNRENAKREAAELASRSGQLESARHPRRTA
ncbi:hypothetical protein T492DRAFT_1009932 [Pavlovales sp. CCMP2436]|nr:hypothetical protein T492DRAFT_1009932 [Pavlovales sp. CCMP2436]